MARIQTRTEFNNAVTALGYEVKHGRTVYLNDKCICTVGEWLDTDRIRVAQNRRERTTSFTALYNSLKVAIKP